MFAKSLPLRIGTRGSPLAMVQAHMVRDLLVSQHAIRQDDVQIVPIKTSGDRLVDAPLSQWGGKGLFTKEIQQALLNDQIDLAVHSMKDMPGLFPSGLGLAAVLPRIDPRDAFISLHYRTIDDLPVGAVVGTSSLRRQAQLLAKRPDIKIIPFRGNVGTRLEKLQTTPAQASFLAMAGLKRLGLEQLIGTKAFPVDVDDMLPAVGQGIIGIECRTDNIRVRQMVQVIHDPQTLTCLIAERQFLAVLNGSCRTPIAGYARLVGDELHFKGEIFDPDGQNRRKVSHVGKADDAYLIGLECGMELKIR